MKEIRELCSNTYIDTSTCFYSQPDSMASASLLKSSPVLDKSEWLKGQTLRQPSAIVRCHPVSPSSLTIRASSYADELIKTAVFFCFAYSLSWNEFIFTNLMAWRVAFDYFLDSFEILKGYAYYDTFYILLATFSRTVHFGKVGFGNLI